jgi:hypothetical protein
MHEGEGADSGELLRLWDCFSIYAGWWARAAQPAVRAPNSGVGECGT